MKLSEHFTLDEMSVSQEAARCGLPNKPEPRHVVALIALCETVLEPLRAQLKRPIVISSGYRSLAINTRIGGSKRSQHCRGEAADILVPGMAPADVVDLIRAMRLPFDQVIDEFGRWTHVSHSDSNRGEVLQATHDGMRTRYRMLA